MSFNTPNVSPASHHAIVTPGAAPVELNLSDFLYEAVDASPFADVKSWSQFFDLVPVDPYIKRRIPL